MQFLGAVVDIHQQQIVQQQILDKVVLIKPLFISHQQVLNLKRRQFSNHIYVVAAALGQQNVLQLMFVKHFKKLIAMDDLAVSR